MDIIPPRHPGEKERYRVTVAQWWHRPDEIFDEYAYLFDFVSDDLGLDPWRMVESVDKHPRQNLYDVWLVNGQCLEDQLADLPIYVTLRQYEMLRDL